MPDGAPFDMSTLANQGQGWCMLCNKAIDADIQAHFDDEHNPTTPKLRTAILSPSDRIQNVIFTLEDIRTSDDPKEQVKRLDEDVIQELYLVRARLAQDLRDSNYQTQ